MASQGSVEKLYTCPVCLEIFDNPVIVACKHRLCKVCFDKYTEDGNDRCPICRQPLGRATVDEEMFHQIRTTRGTCPDCGHMMTLASLRTHSATCPHRNKNLPQFAPVAETKQPIPRDVPNRATFQCPYCQERNLSIEGLLKHCNSQHRNAPAHVVCPVCASMPWGDPNMKSGNFLQHLNMRHKFEYDTYVAYDVDDDKMLEEALKASMNQ
ncbi:hypothetical protein LSH36_362g04047 [Paralvinella palmiformis]|uniref:RING-type domain-containing protein n=1 Tax=Paralvinella palmiformis TaxID=53620 RepID=A0AAD9JE49_9ANNE|nr:hypothetical protein LSH36_362g04047 [Paralvinella palmiformis]